MTLTVVVLGPELPAPTLAPEVVRSLVRLGVTDVSLVSGECGSALVLSGWSLDGRGCEQRLLDVVAPGAEVSVMHGVAEISLQPDDSARSPLDSLSAMRRNA